MDEILADLLRASGRTEQKVDDLSLKVDRLVVDHENRLRRLERSVGKVAGLFTVISLPATLAWKYLTRKHSA